MDSFITFFMEKWAAIYAVFLVFLAITLTFFTVFSCDEKKPVFFRMVVYVLGFWALIILDPHMTKDTADPITLLSNFAFTVAGIIGASIAVIFSFSTFIMQSISSLISFHYLSILTKERKENVFFAILAILTALSCSIPFLKISKDSALTCLLIMLWVALCLVYELYIELRSRISLRIALEKIKNIAIKEMISKSKLTQTGVRVKNGDIEKEDRDDFNPAIKHVRYLYEIGLKFSTRHEITGCNFILRHIHDLYLKHLDIEDGHFKGLDYLGNEVGNLALTYQTLGSLESMGTLFIREKRKDNAYRLTSIYENIIRRAIHIKYDPNANVVVGPILISSLAKYSNLIESMLSSSPFDWGLMTSQKISELSKITLREAENSDNFEHIYQEIDEIIDKMIEDSVLEGLPEDARIGFLVCLIDTYFDQIKISLVRPKPMSMFWTDIFNNLDKLISSLSLEEVGDILLERLFSNFHSWQRNITSSVLESENKEKERSDFITLLQKWSSFPLYFAKNHGLNTSVSLFIFNSMAVNLENLHKIKRKFSNLSHLNGIYETNIEAFSHFFQGVSRDQEISWRNFSIALDVLKYGIAYNLEHRCFDVEPLLARSLSLIEDYLNRTKNNRSEIMVFLHSLYVSLREYGYGKTPEEAKFFSKIAELKER